jgi:FkbM family methyltransferase
MIDKFVQAIARRFGYTVIPNWRMDDLALASHLRRLFAALEISTVLDVGANAGQYRDFLRNQVGFEGYIVSFEPVAALVEQLRLRVSSDPRWQILPWALGASDSKGEINVTRGSDFSSFLKPETSLLPQHERLNVVDHQETVSVKRLDGVFESIVRDLPPGGRVFLKMDTQGYDLEVMKGASGILDQIAALQSEVSVIPIYAGMPDYVMSAKTLADLGFDITGMFPVSEDALLRVVEFDCVMINRRCIATPRASIMAAAK